jgi:hypothetical protein
MAPEARRASAAWRAIYAPEQFDLRHEIEKL